MGQSWRAVVGGRINGGTPSSCESRCQASGLFP